MEWVWDNYDWFRALHIISVIAWMAGIFYLPRLYVYHAEQAETGSQLSETLKVMERRLLKAIMNPAMIASWLFGLAMLLNPYYGLMGNGWMHVKLSCVVLMTVFHMALAKWRRDFANDANKHSGKFYRIMNEVPTLLMIIIVIMAVVEPF